MTTQRYRHTIASIPEDIEELCECQWRAFENPRYNFFGLFCPIYTTREQSLKEYVQRMLDGYNEDKRKVFTKVIDTQNGNRIAGGCLWKVCPNDPGLDDPLHPVDWHPEGGRRQYAEAAMKRMFAARAQYGKTPQIHVNILFVDPDYRRQGLAGMFLQYGIDKANEMGIEMWLDATSPTAVPLYKKYGFASMPEVNLRPEPPEYGGDEDWKAMDKELDPMSTWPMWRPAGGGYVEGVTKTPWEGREDGRVIGKLFDAFRGPDALDKMRVCFMEQTAATV